MWYVWGSASVIAKTQTFGPWSRPKRQVNILSNGMSQLRLSLTSGTSATSSDVTGASALLLEAHTGNQIMIPTEWGEWRAFTLPRTSSGLYEVSHGFLASSPYALVTATVYDVFAYLNSSGFVDFEIGPAWTSASARATAGAITARDGATVLARNPTRLLVGTLYSSGTNTAEDSFAKRTLWNLYNQVWRPFRVIEATASWNYSTLAWRQANGAAGNQVAVVTGLSQVAEVRVVAGTYTTGADSCVGIGVDSTTPHADCLMHYVSSDGGTPHFSLLNHAALGYRTYKWCEQSVSAGVTSFYGTTVYGPTGLTYAQCGISGGVLA